MCILSEYDCSIKDYSLYSISTVAKTYTHEKLYPLTCFNDPI